MKYFIMGFIIIAYLVGVYSLVYKNDNHKNSINEEYCNGYAKALNFDNARIVGDLCVVPDLEHPGMDLPLFKF